MDCLLGLGFTDLTVLDISESAIARAKARLGSLADLVTWIVADIEDFVPQRSYDLWHDREAGIRTLATTCESARDLKQLFENQVVTVQTAFRRTPFPKRNIETSLRVVHGIVSVTRVCLRRYLILETERGALPKDDRAAMVCDMEKWKNMAAGAWFCLFRTR